MVAVIQEAMPVMVLVVPVAMMVVSGVMVCLLWCVVGLLGRLLWVGCGVSGRCSLWSGGRSTWWRRGVWGWLCLLWWLGWNGPIVRVFAGGDCG